MANLDTIEGVDHDDEAARHCPCCGGDVEAGALSCTTCGDPLDDPDRGICGFCGVATSERCAGCGALVCWECSGDARTGATALSAGEPWCPDCGPGAPA